MPPTGFHQLDPPPTGAALACAHGTPVPLSCFSESPEWRKHLEKKWDTPRSSNELTGWVQPSFLESQQQAPAHHTFSALHDFYHLPPSCEGLHRLASTYLSGLISSDDPHTWRTPARLGYLMFPSDLSQWLVILFPQESSCPISPPALFLFRIRFYFLPEHNHRVLPLLQQDVISLHLTSPSTMGVPVPGPLFHSTLCYNHSHIELFPLPPSRRIHLEGRDYIVVSPARPKTQLGMLKALSKYFSCWIKDCIVDKYPLIYFILI